MYDEILVPTDGSEGARQALEHALGLAETYGSTVHAIYVVEPIYTGELGTERVMQAMEAEGKRAIAETAEQAESRGIPSVTEIRRGSPHGEILEYVDENDVDLVVMGTHGRTGLDRYLLGSVTEKVVRLSDVPVLTVREHTHDED